MFPTTKLLGVSFGLAVVVLGACASDLDPSGAGKACARNGECASGYVCDLDLGICIEPGGALGGSGGTAGTRSVEDSGTADVELPDADCATPSTFYLDADGDGFGRDDTQAPGCALPTGWATEGGDCADEVSSAFPGQTGFFAAGYTVGSSVSFDFDCDGSESGDTTQPDVAPDCADDVGCNAEGYLETSRSGAGVNPICGSDQLRSCSLQLIQCVDDVSTAEPKRCR
jgi:hypothetical protein